MADDADLAQIEIEADLAKARLRAGHAIKLAASGHCHNCDEPVQVGQLFCDRECARDFEKCERGAAMQGN